MEEEPKGALLVCLGLPQAREAAVGGARAVRLSSGIARREEARVRTKKPDGGWWARCFGAWGGGAQARAEGGPRRDGATRLIESRIVLELQFARGIRSAYGAIGT